MRSGCCRRRWALRRTTTRPRARWAGPRRRKAPWSCSTTCASSASTPRGAARSSAAPEPGRVEVQADQAGGTLEVEVGMEQHPAHQHAAEGRAEPPPRGFGAHGRSWVPLALALLLTLLNAPKPLHVDDGFFWQYARQIAVAPSDPYGFLSFLDERPEPANQMLAPPVLPYWWAIGMRLFGERPLLWKLWLFPIVWLFTHSLHALLQRFAAGLEQPLLVLVVLSPVVLPALNLMLDIPALALSLCAFRLYLLASDTLERDPAAAYRLAFAAGVVAAF